jgi:hypothetical protein
MLELLFQTLQNPEAHKTLFADLHNLAAMPSLLF